MTKNILSSLLLCGNNEMYKKNSQDLSCICNCSGMEEPEFDRLDDVCEQNKCELKRRSSSRNILEKSKNVELSCEARNKICGGDTAMSLDSPVDYLDREIFPILLIAMESMLNEARILDVLRTQRCLFNGLDRLAEYLWNNNPKWPSRKKWLDVYDIPQFKLCLKLRLRFRSPRPIFPKSWLWSTDEAAFRIQRYVRGWLVRKRDDVQELRQFWKIIRNEKRAQESSETAQESREMDICERYKLLAKKREQLS